MIVAMIGSRKYKNLRFIVSVVNKLPDICTVISGGAEGADKAAVVAANDRGLATKEYLADWEDISNPKGIIVTRRDGTKYDKLAGYRRNAVLADKADLVIAFWDGSSGGTMDTVRRAKKLKKKVIIFSDREHTDQEIEKELHASIGKTL